jgi:glycosyltransferase involved in cell wall biosynthesis
MIEAMACGTPVTARLQGAVPEVMEQGITGFVVKEIEGELKHNTDIGPFYRTIIFKFYLLFFLCRG